MSQLASPGREVSPSQSQSLSKEQEDISKAFEIEDTEVEEEDLSCCHKSTLPITTPTLKAQMSVQSLSEQPEVDLSEGFEFKDMEDEVEQLFRFHNSTLATKTPTLKLQTVLESVSEQPEVDLCESFEIEDMAEEAEQLSCFHNPTLPADTPTLKPHNDMDLQLSSGQPGVDLSEAFEIEDFKEEVETICNSSFTLPFTLEGMIFGFMIPTCINPRPLHRRIIELRTGMSSNRSPRRKQKTKLKDIKHKKDTSKTRLSPLSQAFSHDDDDM